MLCSDSSFFTELWNFRLPFSVFLYYHKQSTGLNAVIENVIIMNAASEGIMSYYDNVTIRDCKISNCGGNGIHFSGSNRTLVDHCVVINTNLTTGVGHEDGCIVWSDECQDIVCTNNYVENGISGFGSIDSVDNSNITIANNTIKNCRTYAFDIVCPDTNPANIVITGNRIYDSVSVEINETRTPTYTNYPQKIIFTDNYLENTRILMVRAQNINVRGNIIDYSEDTTKVILEILEARNINIEGNIVLGGAYGLHVYSTSENITCSRNQFINQKTVAIYATDVIPNLSICHNTIKNTEEASASYLAIIAKAGTFIHGNQINLVAGQYGIYCAGNGVLVNTNKIITPTGVPSVRCDGGTSGNFITNNFVTQPVSDGGTNTVENTYTITQLLMLP